MNQKKAIIELTELVNYQKQQLLDFMRINNIQATVNFYARNSSVESGVSGEYIQLLGNDARDMCTLKELDATESDHSANYSQFSADVNGISVMTLVRKEVD